MYEILDRLLTFIQPATEQWDDHQVRIELVTAQLLEMMHEGRRPHDLQNEVRLFRYSNTKLLNFRLQKKLIRLDATLDEMRTASNETSLSRLLLSANEQLDRIKGG
jgi:hypothetical protein